MRNKTIKYLSIFLIGALLFGCAGSEIGKRDIQESDFTPNRERALEHYINGLIYDMKGDYASAILEYQDALRYDRDPTIYYSISKDYSLLGKHSLAAQSARQSIKCNPKNIQYWENLAEIFLYAAEIDSAAHIYDNIIRLDSNNYSTWYNAARLFQFKSPLKALEIYQTIIKRFGPSLEVAIQTAELCRNLGKLDDAATALKTALDIDPGNIDIKKMLGEIYITTNKSDSALAIFKDIVETLPTDVTARAALVHIYLLKQDYSNAAHHLEFVLKNDVLSLDLQLHFGRGILSYLQNDSAVAPYAIKLFEKIQEQYPNNWEPYWFLGITYEMMKSDSAAIWNFRKVIEIDSNNVDAWVYLASIYMDSKDYNKIIELLSTAQQYIKNEFRIYLLLGLAYERTKAFEKAAITLERALLLNERNVDALSILGLVYDKLKRYDDLDSLYEKALRLYPDNHLLLNNYAYSLSERNLHINRALEMAKEAIRQQPQNPSYLDTMGWIYFQMGDYEKAEQYIKQAIEYGETSAVILEHLGDVYFKINDINQAMKYWQKALEHDKENDALKNKILRGSL